MLRKNLDKQSTYLTRSPYVSSVFAIIMRKSDKGADRMMRNIQTHANAEWREHRSTSARILDPKNQDKMKRRRVGVVHTNWDSLMVKWSGSQNGGSHRRDE